MTAMATNTTATMTGTDYSIFIPARMEAQRLPGKPLLKVAGKTLIAHVCERALEAGARQVVVATDDARIAAEAGSLGVTTCMTARTHRCGTERLAEAAALLGLPAEAIIVNLQGDEPLMPVAALHQVAALLSDSEADAATLCRPLEHRDDFADPNVVKVVCDQRQRALYFSRAPIPWPRESRGRELPGPAPAQRHLGLYAYRVGLLQRYQRWQPHPLEQTEQLEQLRLLAHGAQIRVAQAVTEVPPGVDSAADLRRLQELLEKA